MTAPETCPDHHLVIHYCRQCNWMLRASWMAQELLHTFDDSLAQVSLTPGTGGVFIITLNGEVLWDRREDGGFPQAAELKRRVRDRIAPDRALGHVDDTPQAQR